MSATADKDAPAGAAGSRRSSAAGDLWRSLDEMAGTPDLGRFIEAEFPSIAERLPQNLDRRTLLKLAGASLSLAGLTACGRAEDIVPYVRQPENVIPGRPLYYATTLCSGGYGIGAVVESHEGRPTKVEGNTDHPASLGATDAVMQAQVLALFDPDRSRTPLKNGEPAPYSDFLGDMAKLTSDWTASGGKGAALLIETGTSPTMKAQIDALRKQYPELRIYRHDPLAATADEEAATKLFGRALTPLYRFDRTQVICSLDADFLGEGPGALAYSKQFAARRRVRKPGDAMNRLYAVESTPTITGAAADHRRAARPSEVEAIAAGLNAVLGGAGDAAAADRQWIAAVVDDLKGAGRNGLVLPGSQQTAFVHAVALAINGRLGAFGNTIDLIEPPHAVPVDGDLSDLGEAISDAAIDTVVALGANPVHTAPAGLDAKKTFGSLKLLVHFGLYRDETALLAQWHVPAAHDLESWSDLRAFDGSASIVQPLILPLFGGRTVHEILAALAGTFDADALMLVRRNWAQSLDDTAWRKALRDGVVAGTAAVPVAVQPPADLAGLRPRAAPAKEVEIRFTADPFLRDGRYANSAMLQELPRPLTKVVWGNAALVSPGTAARLKLENGRTVNLDRNGLSLDAPAWIVPGHPDDTVTLSFGFGRKAPGAVAPLAAGYDAFLFRTADAPWFADGVALSPRDETQPVVTTQHHHAMEGRPIVRHASLAEFARNPDFVRDGVPPAPAESIYPDWTYHEEAWAMSIDLSACVGCMACVAACQAENNIATVGPDEVARGHEMHWLRIDRYYAGEPEAPDTYFQPVPCMHCEKAPCEVVCPVNATVHTHDGLNAQVYNRCIGTRYCSQNCPYKVRRFNFLDYREFDKGEAGPEQAARNPDVSVRSRGVMEKCTYCVQRISEKRIHAQIENRPIRDGEVVTACQQACPTRAIIFGDRNLTDSEVSREKAAPQSYGLLEDLNTRPRTTYLGRISNPNPRLAGASEPEPGNG